MTTAPSRPRLLALGLLLPGLLPLAVLFVLPFAWSLLGSLGIEAGRQGMTSRYYAEIFTRPALLRALGMSMYYGIAPVVVTLPLAVALALLLRRHFFGRELFSVLYKIPMAVPGIIAALVVMTLFDRGGFVDRLLAPLGMHLPRMIRDAWGVGVVATSVWKQMPLMTLIAAGAFASIPADISLAARSLGAGRWRALWFVELPLAMPGISVAILLSFIATLGYYAIPDLLGPASPQPLAVHMVAEFGLGHQGLVDAIGMVLTAFAMAVLAVHGLATRRASHFREGAETPEKRT
jgi:putative spermidine/putrescine transport system permease protein